MVWDRIYMAFVAARMLAVADRAVVMGFNNLPWCVELTLSYAEAVMNLEASARVSPYTGSGHGNSTRYPGGGSPR